MPKIGTLHFYPERIGWIGGILLIFGSFLSLPLLYMLYSSNSSPILLSGRKEMMGHSFFSFSLGLNRKGPSLPIPELQGEMSLSFDPPRPSGMVDGKRLLVRLRKSGFSKRLVLPCRLDLQFEGDQLKFASAASPFWLELSLKGEGQIEGRAFIASLEGEKLEVGNFVVAGQESPLREAQEFAEGSPFRLLADAHWLGRDQFMEEKNRGERLEVGVAGLLELKDADWLIWKDQKWQKSEVPEKDLAVAHIQSISGKGLILEGWDVDGHIRISLNPAAGLPFKTKGEDLLSAIRVRSEKQISCMLEKQCMVLKTGDWVLKAGGRWKVLRKKEERDAFVNGKLSGELFVFEQISQKQGQKMILGRLFNPGRTQVVGIEMGAQQTGKKGRGKSQ